MKAPHLLVIGAQKAATTWLQHVFATDPRFFVPPGTGEIHFFDAYYERGMSWYLQLYQAAPPFSVSCDVTPDYLYSKPAPQRAVEAQAGLDRPLRIVLIVREPISRLVSAYQMQRRRDESLSLREALERRGSTLIEKSTYSASLRSWLTVFPRETFHFILFDALRSNERAVLDKLAVFLGMEGSISSPYGGRRVNPGGLPRIPVIEVLLRFGGRGLRVVGWDGLLHRMKSSHLMSRFREMNRKELALSEEEKHLLEDLKGSFFEDVRELSTLVGEPRLCELWGYSGGEEDGGWG